MKYFPFCLACLFVTSFSGIQDVECQVYSWTKQPGDIYSQPCINQLNFTWTYTPASPDPALIEWSKLNAGGTFDAVANIVGVTFTPAASYTGRVRRIGNTAELGLLNPTSADDGTYRVSVTDGYGKTITSQNVVVFTVTTASLESSGITATCGTDGKTVTCAGVTSLGIPGAILSLSYGSSSKDNGGTQTTVSKVVTSRENVTCSISGPATECLAAGVINSTSVQCGLRVCDVVCTYVSGLLSVLGLGSYIIYIILSSVLEKKIPVLQILFVVTMTAAGAAIIGGGAYTGVTVDKRNSCEGQICDTGLGLSFTSLVIGIAVLAIMIFVYVDYRRFNVWTKYKRTIGRNLKKEDCKSPSGDDQDKVMTNKNNNKKDDTEKKNDKEKKDERLSGSPATDWSTPLLLNASGQTSFVSLISSGGRGVT